jgi:hypothetical protein
MGLEINYSNLKDINLKDCIPLEMPFAIDEITINLRVDIPENKSTIDTFIY